MTPYPHLPSNLKKIRSYLGLTQADIALQLNKRNTAISSWENGLSSPSFKDIVKLSEIFGFPIADLIETEVKLSHLIKYPDSTKTSKKSNLKSPLKTPPNDILPQKSRVGNYLIKHAEIYLSRLGKVYDLITKGDFDLIPWIIKSQETKMTQEFAMLVLPDLGEGIHIRVAALDDHMHPLIRFGDKVVATYLPEPATTLREGKVHIILDKEDGIVCRRIYKEDDASLVLSCDNTTYPPYKRHLNDIQAVFKVVEIHSRYLGKPTAPQT